MRREPSTCQISCLVWVENAEPGSRDRTESGRRHRNGRISLLFPKMEICNLLGMELNAPLMWECDILGQCHIPLFTL